VPREARRERDRASLPASSSTSPALSANGSPDPGHLDRAFLARRVNDPGDVTHFFWKAGTFGVKVRTAAAIRTFLAHPHTVRAIRRFNLTLMNRGRNAYQASHCHSLADVMVGD
jgi:hypothetical protein